VKRTCGRRVFAPLLISLVMGTALTLPGCARVSLPEARAKPESITPEDTQPPIPSPTPPADTPAPTFTPSATVTPSPTVLLTATPSPTATSTPTPLPTLRPRVVLEPFVHDWQTWNNCGPAALSIGLSYFGVERTQAEIAAELKPEVADKNVSLSELLQYADDAGVAARARVSGTVDLLRQLVNSGIPVLTEGWLQVGEDIGHYRIVRGYDLEAGQLLTQDSYHGPNLWLATEDFEAMWQPFFFAYAPLYRVEQEPLVAAIIGPDWDDEVMITHALVRAQSDVDSASENPYAWYNLGDARQLSNALDGALSAYERAVEIGLPDRFFWYRFGFFVTLNDLGQHQRVLESSEPLVEEVPSLAELRVERGHALRSLGRNEEAIAEYEQALPYLSQQDELLAILADLQL